MLFTIKAAFIAVLILVSMTLHGRLHELLDSPHSFSDMFEALKKELKGEEHDFYLGSA